MRIISININNFGGYDSKPIKKFFKDDDEFNFAVKCFRMNQNRVINAELITKRIIKYKADIIVFHEFDVESPAGNVVFNLLSKNGYYAIFPNGENVKKNWGNCSITLMFSKEELISKNVKSEISLCYRWNEVNYSDYLIVGIHIPDSTTRREDAIIMWNGIENHFKGNKDKKVVYIGDFNVYKEHTPGKEKMNRLLNEYELYDLWISCGYLNEMESFIGGTRIDYALVGKEMVKGKILNDTYFIEKRLTDHSAIIVDI